MIRIFIVIVCAFCWVYTDKIKDDPSCFTPDGKWGTCVELSQCPVLANLSPTRENINYQKISRCEAPDRSKINVCCGPPRESNVKRTSMSKCPMSAAPPDPRTSCCGYDAFIKGRVVGGEKTSVYQYPWLVRIEYDKERIPDTVFCGGSLISNRYVLTAAHCVYNKQAKNIILDDYNRTRSEPDCMDGSCTDVSTVIPIQEIIIHPDYKRVPASVADIALIRLKDSAALTMFIRLICLPTSDLRQERKLSNVDLYVVGWGLTEEAVYSDVKVQVNVPYVPKQECEEAYGNRFKWSTSQICAGGVDGKDSCAGDSGGPLQHYLKDKYTLVGIVSFGTTHCGTEGLPSVYTYVYDYLPWIRTQVKP